LGPLGDDFPAIFPIAMGLLFFFSAVTLTQNYYHVKQETAVLMAANNGLAKIFRSQTVIDAGFWKRVCELVDTTKSNYGVRAKLELLEFDPGKGFTPLNSIGGEVIESPCVDTVDDNGRVLPRPEQFSISLTYPVLIKIDDQSQKIATLRLTTW
jgi:hypothetical protein